jgi:CRISPR/Cas system-associated exonuclease Cas4 (RecB family)
MVQKSLEDAILSSDIDPNKLELSATKIAAFIFCPFSYFLKYVKHEDYAKKAVLVFGKEIHYMLESFYKKNFKSAETFSKFFKHRWFEIVAGNYLNGKEREQLETVFIPTSGDKGVEFGNHIDFIGPQETWIGQFFTYMRDGSDILQRFYPRHKDKQKPLEFEKRFKIKFRGFNLIGVWDRIDLNNGKTFITDYKTDKCLPSKDSVSLLRHPQFTIYSAAYKKVYDDKEEGILYYHLRSGEVLKTTRGPDDYDYLERLCEEVTDGIVNKRFLPKYESFSCNFCDVKKQCLNYSVDKIGPKEAENNSDAINWSGFDVDDR